jgi:hypothetical protein
MHLIGFLVQKVCHTFIYWLQYHTFCSLGYTEFNKKGVRADPNNANKFTLSQLVAATSNFAEANWIGEGGFGWVYKGQFDQGQVHIYIFHIPELIPPNLVYTRL